MFNWIKKIFKKKEEIESKPIDSNYHLRIKRGSITTLETKNIILMDGEPVLVKRNGEYIGFKIGRNDSIEVNGKIVKGSYFNALPLYRLDSIIKCMKG